MKKRKFPNLKRKDWQVIITLLIALVVMIGADLFAIHVLNEYSNTSSTIHESARQLRLISWLSTLLVLFMTIGSIYYLIKTVAQRNKEEEARKRKHQELKQHISLIEELYEKAPIGFHSTDKEGTIIEMNQTELDWLGYKREEVVGKMKLQEISAWKKENLSQLMEQLKQTGKLENLEGQLKRKDGTLLSCISSSRSVYDASGKYDHSRVAVMDYTEKKKLLLEIEQAKESAERSSLLKEQFVANMSHEIRTPLNAILSFSKLMERTELSERQKEFIQSIHGSSENLLTIINDILDFSKIEAGVLRIENITFSPAALVHSVENMFRYKAEEKQLQFVVRISGEIPDGIMGDPNRLTQILVNLLGNAFKFTNEGSVILEVDLARPGNENVFLRFTVKDSGIGIPSDKLEAIFKRFGQATADTTRKYGGAGLGLTISKQLVDLQKGSIQVESVEGEGTTFTVEIPYKIVGTTELSTNGQKSESDIFKSKQVKILVTEDNPMNRRILELQFENWGIIPDQAENGRVAIEMLRKKAYDLILMDIQMPEMDGYTTAKFIRKELQLQIPIIATTAHAFSGEREKCISYGMNDYLSKPIHEEELFNMLKRYLSNEFQKENGQRGSTRNNNIMESFDKKYVFAITKGKPELLHELATLTINQTRKEIAQMDRALQQNDFVELAEAAHSMRNTVFSMGFNKLMGELLRNLEIEANSELPDVEHVNKLLGNLKELQKESVVFLTEEFLK